MSRTGYAKEWFKYAFFSEAMRILGLGVDDFVTFEKPTRVASVAIPCPSVQEQRLGHMVYSSFCQFMASKLVGIQTSLDDRPVYLSKSRLSGGVGSIINEVEIEEVMTTNGVEVIYPEELKMPEQIRIFQSRPTIIGTAGSFLHTAIFSASPRRIVVLNPSAQINSNFLIIDGLSGSNVSYLHSKEVVVIPPSKDSTFLTRRYLPNAPPCSKRTITRHIEKSLTRGNTCEHCCDDYFLTGPKSRF